VLTARLWLPQPNEPSTGPYFTHEARVTFYRRVLERLAQLPGVESVGGISTLPLSGTTGRASFTIEGQGTTSTDVSTSQTALVTPGYFRTLGVDLVRGRSFSEHDDVKAPSAIVVSESFARQFFANTDAVGKRIVLGTRVRPASGAMPPAPPNWWTILGVVRDVKTDRLDAGATPMFYRSVLQVSNLNLTLVVRAQGDPAVLAESMRREVRAVDPNEPLFGIRTMNAVVATAMAERRFTMQLLALFAATALVLSAIGIYGVMAYFVTQRTHEIGIRMALGAAPRDVLAMVLGQGARLAAAGAFALTRAIGTLLFGVSPRDPLTFATLSIVLTAVALVACYVPARRATRVDPIRALRYE
jgi:putative ABC transport system permease protein